MFSVSLSKRSTDEKLASMLTLWANECSSAAARLERALLEERDPINTGLDMSAKEEIPGAIGDMRKNSYPAIEFLIQLLPDTNPVGQQAWITLESGKTALIKYFDISVPDIANPTITIDT